MVDNATNLKEKIHDTSVSGVIKSSTKSWHILNNAENKFSKFNKGSSIVDTEANDVACIEAIVKQMKN